MACGLTHAALTPVDVMKTNMQASFFASFTLSSSKVDMFSQRPILSNIRNSFPHLLQSFKKKAELVFGRVLDLRSLVTPSKERSNMVSTSISRIFT